MIKKNYKSVLIIDDDKEYGNLVGILLKKKGYQVRIVNTIEEASEYLESEIPSFIFTDRILSGDPVEKWQLKNLIKQSTESLIVVYTRMDQLSINEINEIQNKGAIRVIDKTEAESLVNNIDILTEEFDDLIELSHHMQAATLERSRLTTAFISLNVGISIIDKYYHCWFANVAQEKLIGNDARGNKCWIAFNNYAIQKSACLRCPIEKAIEKDVIIEKQILSTYKSGATKWVTFKAYPIKNKKGEVVAIRKATCEIDPILIKNMPSNERLQKIANSLVETGFGRVRIYKSQKNTRELKIVAAASIREDNFVDEDNNYLKCLKNKNTYFNPKDHIDGEEALNSANGIFIEKYEELSKSDSKNDFNPPKFSIPIKNDRRELLGWLSLDFNGISGRIYDETISKLARQETLVWLKEFVLEIRNTFLSKPNENEYRLSKIIQNARLEIGASSRPEKALREFKNALSSLIPGCSVCVRIYTEDGLEIFQDLSFGELLEKTSKIVDLNNKESTSAYVIKSCCPLWINDQRNPPKKYNHFTYKNTKIKSIACIPLKFEEVIFGSLKIGSIKKINWEEYYKYHLEKLTAYASLIIRDVAFDQCNEKTKNEKTALVAFSAGATSHAIWRHWANQRLSELSAISAIGRTKAQKNRQSEFVKIFEDMSGLISEIRRGEPSYDQKNICDINSIFSELKIKYKQKIFNFSINTKLKTVQIRAPKYIIRSIIEILINNSREAIEETKKGNIIKASVKKYDNFVEILIEDNGPGIPEQIKLKLFSQLPGSKKTGRGVGLLYARGAALNYGGDLSFKSNSDSTLFILKMPTITINTDE